MSTTSSQIHEAADPDGLQRDRQFTQTKEHVEFYSQHSAAVLGLDDDSNNGLRMDGNNEFSKDYETKDEKLIGNITLTIQDGDGDWEGMNTDIDSGSTYSLIHPDIVKSSKLKPRPLFPKDRVTISSPFDKDRTVEITHIVILKARCKKIDLEPVDLYLGIVKGDWGVLIGQRSMNRHNLWTRIGGLLEKERRGEILRAIRITASKAHENSDRIAHEKQREEALKIAKNVESSISSTRSFTSSNSDWAGQASSASSQQSSDFTHQAIGKN